MNTFHNGTPTSIAAAQSIPAASMAEVVFETIAGAGGMTCEEVEVMLGYKHQTASARIRGLVLDGRIVDSGVKRYTDGGRKATVWRVA